MMGIFLKDGRQSHERGMLGNIGKYGLTRGDLDGMK
jgi:hypothetical protein